VPKKFCKVKFFPNEVEIDIYRKGENLLRAAMVAGVHINASCGGNGSCGKCKVKILNGDYIGGLSPKLSADDIKEGYRLACQTRIMGDLEVEIPIESQVDKSVLRRKAKEAPAHVFHALDIQQLVKGWIIDPTVFKRYIELSPPTLDDNISDLERVTRGLKEKYGIEGISTDFRVIKKLAHLIRKADWKVTATLVLTRKGYKLINLEEGDVTAKNYSIVLDIGTTTIFGQLLNLYDCKIFNCSGKTFEDPDEYTLAEASDYNAQISYGEDVITRIVFSQKPGGLKTLQEAVIKTINGIIDELLNISKIDRDKISHLVIAGNTTMTQILLGLDPKYIREAPYVPTANFIPPVRAIHLGINVGEHVHMYIFPLVASYMGGDIVSGVLGSGIFQREETTLYIDIGTNGEIVLGNKDWLASCSCSAGPAFEGGGVKFGMRATKGAIEQISINPTTFEPMFLTIGKQKPKGICGSGLIDAMAEFLLTGIIDQNGKFNRDLPTNRIRKGEIGGYEYVIAWREDTQIDRDITITEADLDNLIRTKGAIYAGCRTLLNSVGLTMQDLDLVFIAGGFGRYLNLEKAVTIGLLPELPPEKFLFVGNGSLLGARLLSFSKDLLKEGERIARMMTNIELSNNKHFMDEFIASLFLPHTDMSEFPSVAKKLEELNRQKGVINNGESKYRKSDSTSGTS